MAYTEVIGIDGVLGEITQSMRLIDAQAIGFPPLPPESIPPCGAWPLCNRTRMFVLICDIIIHLTWV
jgi:hypothetical protein